MADTDDDFARHVSVDAYGRITVSVAAAPDKAIKAAGWTCSTVESLGIVRLVLAARETGQVAPGPMRRPFRIRSRP